VNGLIAKSVEILRVGGLVAFPTETVYGLGGDARSAAAVRKIFAAKGRPATNPLIVHVADAAVARRYARQWPESADKLANAFWPGPLTIVLPKDPSIVDEATAGLGTVGLRVPDHPLTLELLRAFDGPLAGPSANRSMRVSPTTAEHVRQELGDRVDLVLDGGPCQVGIESTVLDLSRARPVILRPGGVSRQQIEAMIGPIEVSVGHVPPTQGAASPGQHEVHYSPRAPTYRFVMGQGAQAQQVVRELGAKHPVLLSMPAGLSSVAEKVVFMPIDPHIYAQRLYATLREADASGADVILIEMPPDEPAWSAVRDRLMRAGRPLPEIKSEIS
jgi:L-threonylcarbamoyladenylate synthase